MKPVVIARREFDVTVLALRSESRPGRWVAYGVETGNLVQGDTMAEVLDLAPSTISEFIEDALNEGADPLNHGCAADIRAIVAEVRANGVPVIFPRGNPRALDEERIERLVLPLRLGFERHQVFSSSGGEMYFDERLAAAR